MTTDHEVAEETPETAAPAAQPAAAAPAAQPAAAQVPLSRTAVVAGVVVGVLLVAWFFVAWLVLEQNVVDALGESVGSAFAILVAVSLVGAFRRNRGPR